MKNHEIGHRLCQTWNVSTTVVGHIKFPFLPSRLVIPVPSDCYSGRLSSHLHRGNLRATPRCENIVVVFFFPRKPSSSIFITTGDLRRSTNFRRHGLGEQLQPNYTSAIWGAQIQTNKKNFENPGAFCHKFCFGSING